MHQWIDEAILLGPTNITGDVFSRMVPSCRNPYEWADAIGPKLNMAGIESNNDIALFIAHAGHETGSFRALQESFNYSTEALIKMFGRHRISVAEAQRYGRNRDHPADRKALANILYGGAWGRRNLGNLRHGDGYKYCGRGIFQLTGLGNYTACAQDTGLDIVNRPELLSEDYDAAVTSALWFWNLRIRGSDVKTTTRELNGGYNGLADRVARYKRALSVLEDM